MLVKLISVFIGVVLGNLIGYYIAERSNHENN